MHISQTLKLSFTWLRLPFNNINTISGTSMSQLGTCTAPQCLQCDQDEYQDTYTTETKCRRQPYCDPSETSSPRTHHSLIFVSGAKLWCSFFFKIKTFSLQSRRAKPKKASACVNLDSIAPVMCASPVYRTGLVSPDGGHLLKVWHL